MKSIDEQIKEKMASYIELIEDKPLQKDINYLIEQSPILFDFKTIRNEENIIFPFLIIMHKYFKNIHKRGYKMDTKIRTTNKRNKKENAIKGAEAIIDYLGGLYTDNNDTARIKVILMDFMENPEKYKNKPITHTITKDDLRSELRKIIPNKSTEIDEFIKGLENFQI